MDGFRISASKSKVTDLSRKRVEWFLDQGGGHVQVDNFKCLKVLFTTVGKMEWEIDRGIGTKSGVKQVLRAEPKDDALNLKVDLRSDLHLCSQTLDQDQKNKIAKTSDCFFFFFFTRCSGSLIEKG